MYLEELLPEFRKGAKIRRNKWENDAYIEKCAQGIIYHNIEEHDVDILANDYELYQEPEPDWDCIIKNKCICWFWNGNENAKINRVATFLYKKPRPSNMCFIDIAGCNWDNCRPVRRDEVTFYEDRKDEHI